MVALEKIIENSEKNDLQLLLAQGTSLAVAKSKTSGLDKNRNLSLVDFIVDVTPLILLADDVVLVLAAIVSLYMKLRKK